ncbi:MAG: hypothetical protein K9H26_12490 [Prolixibacteraceae bacterium]|nr:hypothetical protein [Prolixibacteraceae bacterium]
MAVKAGENQGENTGSMLSKISFSHNTLYISKRWPLFARQNFYLRRIKQA